MLGSKYAVPFRKKAVGTGQALFDADYYCFVLASKQYSWIAVVYTAQYNARCAPLPAAVRSPLWTAPGLQTVGFRSLLRPPSSAKGMECKQ